MTQLNTKTMTNLYVARCFDVDGYGEENLADIFVANSMIHLTRLLRDVQHVHGAYHHIKFSRDMPRYYGIAHLKLAEEFCA